MLKRMVVVLLVALVLVGCGSVARNFAPPDGMTTQTPETFVQLVDNGDDVKDVRSVAHEWATFDDIYLEQGTAAAQILCSSTQNVSVGSASALNAAEYTSDRCPELLLGVRAQIVNTQTVYAFDCRHCTVSFEGKWESGNGVKVWRGTIQITATSDKTPSLVLYPLNQP